VRDLARAAAAVAASPLFDEEWYAAQTGAAYSSRTEAAADYVTRAGVLGASPHPLFEPAWLYPGERWRREAPDPLSHYLARPDRRAVGTHPLLPRDAEEWARSGGPDTPLPRAVGRPVTYAEVRAAAFETLPVEEGARRLSRNPRTQTAQPAVSVVIAVGDRFQRPCSWLRSLYRTEVARAGLAAELLVCVNDPAHRRLATLSRSPCPAPAWSSATPMRAAAPHAVG